MRFISGIFRFRKISQKLLFLILGIGVAPVLLLVYLANIILHDTIEENIFANLKVASEERAMAIDLLVREKLRDVSVFAEMPHIYDAMEKYENAFRLYGPESDEFMSLDSQFKPTFNTLVSTFNYNNIFLISLNGDIVFSQREDIDIGENLIHGSFRNTKLAQSFRKTCSLLKPDISEIEFIEPTDVPLVFVSAPIKRNNQIRGVISFQPGTEKIYNLAFNFMGLKKTGETVLAIQRGNEAIFITPTRHHPGAVSGQKIFFGSEIASPVQKAVLGQSGS